MTVYHKNKTCFILKSIAVLFFPLFSPIYGFCVSQPTDCKAPFSTWSPKLCKKLINVAYCFSGNITLDSGWLLLTKCCYTCTCLFAFLYKQTEILLDKLPQISHKGAHEGISSWQVCAVLSTTRLVSNSNIPKSAGVFPHGTSKRQRPEDQRLIRLCSSAGLLLMLTLMWARQSGSERRNACMSG